VSLSDAGGFFVVLKTDEKKIYSGNFQKSRDILRAGGFVDSVTAKRNKYMLPLG